MATAEKPKGGLEDVVATSSAICYLDGDRGVLAYCGHDIHDLASSAISCGTGVCPRGRSSAISSRSLPRHARCRILSCA